MINILLRTHDREAKFAKCIKSIENQTYKDYRLLISADNERAGKWVKKLGYDPIRTDKIVHKRIPEKSRMKKGWNLYHNTLQRRVTDGFIMYMDEDMLTYSENSLQLVADNAQEDKLLIYKYRVRDDIGCRPSGATWMVRPKRTYISTACFCHHHKHFVKWRGISAGDYFAVTDLYNKLETIWLDKIILMGQQP